jgi:hypothetical protein
MTNTRATKMRRLIRRVWIAGMGVFGGWFYVGKEAGKRIPPRPDAKMNFAKLRTAEVVKVLESPNVWQRRMAQRILRIEMMTLR